MSATADAFLLVRAKSHLHRRAEVLADFEAETIRDTFDRVIVRRSTPLSLEERRVVTDALDAMSAARTQDLTDKGLAA